MYMLLWFVVGFLFTHGQVFCGNFMMRTMKQWESTLGDSMKYNIYSGLLDTILKVEFHIGNFQLTIGCFSFNFSNCMPSLFSFGKPD